MNRRVLVFATALLFLTAGVALAQTPTTIYNVQQMVHATGTQVSIDNVVVTGIDSAPTTYGFWGQELGGGPYGGVLFYTGAINTGGLRPGHIVNVIGVYEEYPSGVHDSLSVSEVTYSPISWEIVDSMLVPNPVLLSCGTFGQRPSYYPTAEQWEGTLIRFDTVKVVRHDPSYSSSYFFIENHTHAPATAGDTVYVRNNKLTSPGPGRPPLETVLTSITGLGHYENGRYHICPRNADDIVYEGAPPAPNLALAYAISNTEVQAVFDCRVDEATAENIGNYYLASETAITAAELDLVGEQIVTLTTDPQTPGEVETLVACCVKSKGPGTAMPEAQQQSFRGGLTPISKVQEPISAVNDSSKLTTEQVTVTGIVTADKTPFITHFYMEERPGGQWRGVQVYGGTPVAVTEGDSIIISGYVSEYFFKTEITGIDYLKVCSSGNPLPGPSHVDPGVIKTGAPTAEPYEGVFVRCDPVFVADTTGFDLYGEWRVSDLTPDTMLIAHTGDYTYIPKPGQWMNIRGPVDYAYTTFRIEPRRDADIDTVNVIGVDPVTPSAPAVMSLEQNFPNPFNPVTTIMFSLPEKGDIHLAIFDVSGRLVKTLHDGVMDAGKYKATWDGRSDAGRVVSSGVYFCKLVTADKVAETKMVLLK